MDVLFYLNKKIEQYAGSKSEERKKCVDAKG